MANQRPAGVLVVGIGNELRGDDAAGLLVARRLRRFAAEAGIEVRELDGDPTALLDAWVGSDSVIITDTSRSGSPPGTIRRLDAGRGRLPSGCGDAHRPTGSDCRRRSSWPERFGASRPISWSTRFEGARFDAGAGLSPEVRTAIPALAEMVLVQATARRK